MTLYLRKTKDFEGLIKAHGDDYKCEVISLGDGTDKDEVFNILKNHLYGPYSDKVGLGQFHALEHCITDWLYMNWGRKISVIIVGWGNFSKNYPYIAQNMLMVFESAFIRASLDIELIHLEPEDKQKYGIIEIAPHENIAFSRPIS